MPPVADWETFPFDGDIRVRPLRAADEASGRDTAKAASAASAASAATPTRSGATPTGS